MSAMITSPTRRSRTTSTSSATSACSARSRRGSRSSSTGGSEMGPTASRSDDVYLRTAVCVETDGWAHFDYVKMPDYRWGIFLEPTPEGRTHRLRRLPWASRCGRRSPASTATCCAASSSPRATPSRRASSSSACSAQTAPSLYDLRNLFQVNVEEGRHLWAMVYLLHTLLRPRRPRGGRGAARAPLAATPTSRASSARSTSRLATGSRSSCSRCSPTATASISSPRSPRAASIRSRARCRFMLTEEAHHMFVGETGVQRVVQAHGRADEAGPERRRPRTQGGIDLPTHPEVPEPLVLARRSTCSAARSRSNAADVLRHRPQGPLQGGPLRRPQAASAAHFAMDVLEDGKVVAQGRRRCATR